VKTLFAGFRQAGDYSVSWNGRDERGEQVANGIYFYRIKSAKGQNSHKTILIR
jgi:flagellar hook assembly protein FlgD